jgi:hypothetical protein
VRRFAVVPLLAVALAGCGGSGRATPADTVRDAVGEARTFPDGADVSVRDMGGGYWVAWGVDGDTAAAAVVRNGEVLRTSAVRVRPLGPDPGETVGTIPQVAAEITATSSVLDPVLLVDGEPLAGKGGGLSPKRITIYGAPEQELDPGQHVVVAYARAGNAATAKAWTFTVR